MSQGRKKGFNHSEATKKRMSESQKKVGTGKWMKNKKNNLGKHWKLSKEIKNKLSEIHKRLGTKPPLLKGEDNGRWKGGITPINSLIRTSKEYKLWRKSVFERDNYTCIWCGAKNGNGKTVILHADHIKPFAYYPELRFAIDNGRTLCRECHKKTETYAGKIKH